MKFCMELFKWMSYHQRKVIAGHEEYLKQSQNEDYLENEDDLKNKEDLKTETNLKNEDILKMRPT